MVEGHGDVRGDRRRPELLKSIVPVFVSFFVNGQVPAHIHEMMRIKTGQINDCTY